MIKHSTAQASHYDQESSSYDAFNEKNAITINTFLEQLFTQHRIATVADFTCGTGSQVLWLTKKGFHVVGSDINAKMLALAQEKADHEKLDISFTLGDMRTTKLGTFDAAITIFNSIGHLTQQDFQTTIRNISSQLNNGGLYVFDIFNLNYLLEGNNITKLTIDGQIKSDDCTVREIQYSTISHDGILASYDIYYEQKNNQDPKISQAFQTLQVYSATQLKEILESNGFKVIKQCNIDGSDFHDTTSERIVTVAQKV